MNDLDIGPITAYTNAYDAEHAKRLTAPDVQAAYPPEDIELERGLCRIETLIHDRLQRLWNTGDSTVRRLAWDLMRAVAVLEYELIEGEEVGAPFDRAWWHVIDEAPPETAPIVLRPCCPKCGHLDTDVVYCDGTTRQPSLLERREAANGCGYGDPEHFHRRCYACRFRWRTDDVLSAPPADEP